MSETENNREQKEQEEKEEKEKEEKEEKEQKEKEEKEEKEEQEVKREKQANSNIHIEHVRIHAKIAHLVDGEPHKLEFVNSICHFFCRRDLKQSIERITGKTKTET